MLTHGPLGTELPGRATAERLLPVPAHLHRGATVGGQMHLLPQNLHPVGEELAKMKGMQKRGSKNTDVLGIHAV